MRRNSVAVSKGPITGLTMTGSLAEVVDGRTATMGARSFGAVTGNIIVLLRRVELTVTGVGLSGMPSATRAQEARTPCAASITVRGGAVVPTTVLHRLGIEAGRRMVWGLRGTQAPPLAVRNVTP